MGHRRTGSIAVEVVTTEYVNVEDVIEEIDDHSLLLEVERRKLRTGGINMFDLLDEIRWHLLRGNVQAGIALIESQSEAARVTDDARQRQFQAMGRAVQ